ncbi:MAG: TonB family protein [Terriglobales bacterium]
MGYQALLFCPDEKLARVVTQVFSELDFNVELVNEPFGAVKKLMTQRYDAIAVDCENEQNATLLFKSARNSQTNQSSLALALVEGQAGVAKAYRIGANLLLTKPINVEQAKGTLRVARGLLRKNSDVSGTSTKPAASAAASMKSAPVAPMTSPELEKHSTPPVLPAKLAFAMQFESPRPAMAASAKVEGVTVAPPAPDIQARVSTEMGSPAEVQLPALAPEISEPAAVPSAPPAKKPVASFANVQGAAAAPAPARDVPAPAEKRAAKPEPIQTTSSPAILTEVTAVPTFSALGEHEASEGSGGAKRILGIAAVLAVAAVLGYFGWTKYGQPALARHAQGVVQKPASLQPAAPVAASPAVPSISTSGMPSATARPAVATLGSPPAKPSASEGNLPTVRIAANPEPPAKKPEPASIRVKSEPAKAQTQAEESAAQVPSPLGVASANNGTLSGLMSSSPASLPRAVPGTLRISQGVSQGLLIRRVQPIYPSTALAMRIQGTVQLEATINKEGIITNLKTVSGDPVLARAAAGAVKQWRYKPYYLDGQPVDIQTQITVNFKLPN